MNNNGFAIMRYFRDLGEDAHLLLYKNDGIRTLGYFIPENDTWSFNEWKEYIHRTNVENGPSTLQGSPYWWSWSRRPLYLLRWIVYLFRCESIEQARPMSPDILRIELSGYDAYVGSGLAPAIFRYAGIKLDIFFPYSTGIEFLGEKKLFASFSDKGSYLNRYIDGIAGLQKDGVRAVRYCINAEYSLTKSIFDQIGVAFIPMTVPMVYVEDERVSNNKLPEYLMKIEEEIGSYEFTILMHSRLMWVRQPQYTDDDWSQISKNNDWLIRAFAKYLQKSNVHACLYLLEYGPDVEETKLLCESLNIIEHVRFLPKMSRRDLMKVVSWCDVSSGEFHVDKNFIWGGTGWEALACGKPLLHSFNFEEGLFESIYGYPPPPMLPVKSQEDIVYHLQDMVNNPGKREVIGRCAAEWFNRYNGIGLAKKWLELIER